MNLKLIHEQKESLHIKLINKLEINLHKFKTGKEITELNLF